MKIKTYYRLIIQVKGFKYKTTDTAELARLYSSKSKARQMFKSIYADGQFHGKTVTLVGFEPVKVEL